jgi:bifunctional non-homologous end joining protein LigD
MSLSLYKQKRTFDKTPEPQSGKSRNAKLTFVIQKHKASRLHYDLRLEMDGVLKSWAVPKEPSMDPRDKRLAIMVEDHPYDYKNFEGTIPKGNYGAGEVIIWDTGTYTPIDESKGKAAQEKSLLKQLKSGSLKFSLQGKKLKGEFALVKTKGMGDNAWLLIKHKEKAVSPMLATLVDEPFDDEAWEFEIKWDGYRALAFRKGKTAELLSRNGKSFAEQFYPVFDALKAWKEEVVIDGEIVVVDEKGYANFQRLQNWRSESDGQLLYYVFDILWHKGRDLTGWPLSKRMELLKSVLPTDHEIIKPGFSVTGRGKEFFASAQKMGLEGIIAKKLSSTYKPGERTKDWLKIKAQRRQEVVIAGFTRNEGSPKLFSSLLLGVYKKGKLHYAGKVGTGFTDSMQKEMMTQFKPLIVKKSPFQELPDYNKATRFRPDPPPTKAHWLKPTLVCEITFAEVTEQGVFRHASFKGMREDKLPTKVMLEKELVRTLFNSTEKTQTLKINRKELKFTNLDKFFWKEEKITKRDLLNYYHQVAPYILPYIKDRPQSLYRFPDGYKGKSFYQKDVTGKVPDWVETYKYHSEGSKKDKHFLVAQDEASLLYMVNFGCIEINPWSSTVKKPDHPDWCLLDLDPGEKTSFNKVIDAANLLHDLLKEIDVPSFPKTSGSTGIHIYIPLGKKYTYEQSKEFARVLVTMVQRDAIRYTTIERTVNARNGKLYLDFLQNRPQATLAAPYSVRPKPGATVSMPLHWEELKQGLKMKDFTLKNVPALLEERGDLFKPVLGKGIDMKAALKRLQQL